MLKGEISDQVVDRFFEERIYQEYNLDCQRAEDANGEEKKGEKEG